MALNPIIGTDTADSLQGTSAEDSIQALAGNDSVTGVGSGDVVQLSQGNDSLVVSSAFESGSVFGGHQQSFCRVSSHVAMIISREAEIASRETILWSLFRSGASDLFTFRTTQPGSTSTRND